MNLSLRQLRAFCAVAETGSFTAAARQLHLTQSALSVLVRELETGLGVKLLDRHTRRVSVSEAGREFLPAVLTTLADLDMAVANVTDLRDQKKGVLRVAAPQLMASTLIPKVIVVYKDRFPEIQVRLADTSPEHLLSGITSGSTEIAIGQDVEVDGSIDCRPMLKDRHWLVCRSDHPFAQRKSVAWKSLEDQAFIAPTRDFVLRVLPQLDASLGVILTRASTVVVSYISTALGMVQAGLGVTVCPGYASSLVQSSGMKMISLVEPAIFRTLCVYSATGRSLSPAASGFALATEEVLRLETARHVAKRRAEAS